MTRLGIKIFAAATGLLLLSFVLSAALAQPAPVTYSCSLNGKVVYQGESDDAAWSRCRGFVFGASAIGVFSRTAPVNGQPVTQRITLANSSQYGLWTWVAPIALENGNILTDLSHYLVYRQPIVTPPMAPQEPTVWAQVDGKAKKLFMRMGAPDYGACFYVVAVRKNALAKPSDKSNTICLDAQGLPLPTT